jgi:hypothetical protein
MKLKEYKNIMKKDRREKIINPISVELEMLISKCKKL